MSLAELIPQYVQASALLAAGLWAYGRFFRQRSNEPATDIEVDVRHICSQGGFHIVEVTATLENKSLVRHDYSDFRMTMRYLFEGEPVEDSVERHNFQVRMPHSIDDRIQGRQRAFANAGYINPRQHFRHRYETFVPVDATVLWVHCRFALTKKVSLLSRLSGNRSLPGSSTAGSSPEGTPGINFVDTQRLFALPARPVDRRGSDQPSTSSTTRPL